jgi:aromatic-L-amino-acid decarboxylase
VELAQEFARWVQADPRFELAVPPPLNLVCFRHRGGDALNQALMERLNGGGELFLTHTRMQDRMTLRMCIGQTQTEKRHVERAWRRIREAAAGLERNQAQG